MENKMKSYLGKAYSDNNHISNFFEYWIKGIRSMPDYDTDRENYNSWRKDNDLDCLYFDGDLNADTLMSVWTPLSWVLNYLNEDSGEKFYKQARDHEDRCFYLNKLVAEQDKYLPKNNELVQLLERFAELAELRCNYILLPDEKMNADRYSVMIDGERVWLYDQVPATLYHIFEKKSLGKYFLNESGEVDKGKVSEWIWNEHLEHGFYGEIIEQEHVIPLFSDANPSIAKLPATEKEIKEALDNMINFLKERSYDRDRNKKSFDKYKKIYKGVMPFGLFDFDKLRSIDKNGYAVRLKTDKQLKNENINLSEDSKYFDMINNYGRILISGDSDFGIKNFTFTSNTNDIAYGVAGEFIENPCEKMHSIYNFSLMLRSGGMNSKKGVCYNDEFPKFTCKIKEYYSLDQCEKELFVRENLFYGKIDKYENWKYIICFLDLFDSFPDYYIKVYFFGEEREEIVNDIDVLMADIIKFGAEKCVCNATEEYCKLAKRYWKIKKKIIDDRLRGIE